MPAYGTPQSGGTPTSLVPGDGPYYLVNAEVVAAGYKSIPFSRGYSPGAADNGCTFQIQWTVAPTAEVDIQGSNVDVDGSYQTLSQSINPIANPAGYLDNYTDTTRWAFYRVYVPSYSAGGALTVTVQR